MLANWLVAMAAWNATAARTVPGKVVGILFPVIMFSAIGVAHAPANFGYIFLTLANREDVRYTLYVLVERRRGWGVDTVMYSSRPYCRWTDLSQG
jgi:formate/nitrite transporter FocA (FNT family)